MLKYGLLLQDDVMLVVNVTAIVLNAIYCAFYYLYSGDKWNELFKPLSVSMGLVAVLWGYCAWEDPTLLEFRYGLIVTILMLLLLGNPLLGVREMIQNKDASQIPFVLTLMGTLVTFAWLLYAIILMNNFMIVQNVIGFILCFVQLILIFKYPGKPTEATKKKKH
jgi:solute carrier family 50 protein (sugar transporter)